MKYSVIVPIYNDAYLARSFCEELRRVFTPLVGDRPLEEELELLFVHDGSPKPENLPTLRALVDEFTFVTVIDLSRNFGQHQAIAAGFRVARGEIVIRMNVDQQDPPSEIPKLLSVLESEHADLVVGRYATRRSPIRVKLVSYCYYALFKFMTGLEAEQNTSPLRVMSRKFVDAYNQLTEKSRFPQGLDLWLGFEQRYVEIEHRERADKKSSYTTRKRLALALTGVLYFSDRPIKLLMGFGAIIAFLGIGLAAYIVGQKLFGVDLLPGYASLASIGLTTFGIQLLSLGVIGLYVGRIFREVQNRPLYLVKDTYTRNPR